MNIKEFNTGEEIVRVEASEISGDRSYIGDKLIFKTIANGCAYFKREKNCTMTKITGVDDLKLRLDDFSNGWEYYQDPNKPINNNNTRLKFNLKAEIQKALDCEDYKLLAELKKIFDKSVKNKL